MPTVDDLTISLTIKDNSNLDKLRKNLDAIIKGGLGGAGGVGGGAGAGSRLITELQARFSDVLKQIDYLKEYIVPVQTSETLEGLQAEAGGLLANLGLEGIKEKLLSAWRGKKGDLNAFLQQYPMLESLDDIAGFLEEKLGDLEQDLREVNLGYKTEKKSRQLVNLVKVMLNNLDEAEGGGKTFFTKFMDIRKEEKARLDKYLAEVLGGKEFFLGEVSIARLKEGAFEKKAEILAEIGKQLEGMDASKLADIEGYFKGIPDIPSLEEAFKAMNMEFTKDLFDADKIGGSDELKMIAMVWLKRLLADEFDPDTATGAIGGYITYINKAFKKIMGKTTFETPKHMDYLLFGKKAAEALEAAGFKNISKALIQTLESKGTISDLFKEKEFYEPIVGKIINVLGNRLDKSFVGSNKINTAILKRDEMLKTIGDTLVKSDERRKKMQDDLMKKIGEMGLVAKLTNSVDELLPLIKQLVGETGDIDLDKPETRELYLKIMALIDQFGKTSMYG